MREKDGERRNAPKGLNVFYLPAHHNCVAQLAAIGETAIIIKRDFKGRLMDFLAGWTMAGINFLASLFVFLGGIGVLAVIALYIIDSLQTRDAIRHNYPVIGRFRDIFTHLGEFFRQYFFALDREEMPFNRAEREWI